MPRYGQFVIGPAGCGKSTYCSTIQNFCKSTERLVHVINLDPDAESFDYEPYADVRDLLSLSDLRAKNFPLGPNGGFLYCLEFLSRNLKWLDEQIGEFEDDYFLFDCPGQIELYCHLDTMQRVIAHLQNTHGFNICTVFVLDCHFLTTARTYLACSVDALAATLHLGCPHVNIMTKVDMLGKKNQKKMRKINRTDFLEVSNSGDARSSDRYRDYLTALADIMTDGMFGGFLPLDITDDKSIMAALLMINNAISYGEDLEPKTKLMDNVDREEDE